MATNSNCAAKGLYKSLGFCKGTTILPGIRTTVYYIPKRHIVKWPTLPDTATAAMGELGKYTGNFVLESDKKWLKIDLVDNKGKIESESQGDKPARTFINKITLSHPESDEEATGFARQANADDFVYLPRILCIPTDIPVRHHNSHLSFWYEEVCQGLSAVLQNSFLLQMLSLILKMFWHRIHRFLY